MGEVLALATPLLKTQPVWVVGAVAFIALAMFAYVRSRGVSLEEHVSISRATKTQVDTLVSLNATLNNQIESLLETNKVLNLQIAEMTRKIDELETKVDLLEKELKEARDA